MITLLESFKDQQNLLILSVIIFNVVDFLLLIFLVVMVRRMQYNVCDEIEDSEKDIELALKNTVKEIELERRTREVNKKYKFKRSKIVRILKQIFFGI